MSLYEEMQQRLTQAVIEREKAALAEVTTSEFATLAYMPTAFESYWRVP